MKKIILFLRNLGTIKGNGKPKLGRWSMDDNKKTELKIFYANEDHCGSCVEQIKDTNDEIKKIKNELSNN